MSAARTMVLSAFAIALGAAFFPAPSHAQWWKPAPRDFEECSESAERNVTSKDVRASLMTECEAKFAGRRKPGGGYTYYDFMQDRHFDIAGPNPTKEEQKRIDEQYTEFLDRRKHNMIVAALAQKQQQAEVESAKPAPPPIKVPIPLRRPPVRAAKTADCQDTSISCGWSLLSAKFLTIKKSLLGPAKKSHQS